MPEKVTRGFDQGPRPTSQAANQDAVSQFAKLERLSASPGAVREISLLNAQIDIRPILPAVQVPTLVLHRRTDARVPIEIGRKPYINVVAADLDGDGHVDLVMPNSGLDSICILFGDGHGHFTHARQSPLVAGPTPFMVAVADLNGDGRPDIVVANYSGHITDTSGDGLTWVRNDGDRITD